MSIEFTDEERMTAADELFRWNTPSDPYFVIKGRSSGHEGECDPYIPISDAILAALAPKIEARVRRARAEAWDEGRDAGHLMARALNPEWPEQTPNPYRVEAVR